MGQEATAEQIKTGDIFTMDNTGNRYTATRNPRHVPATIPGSRGGVLITCSYQGKRYWQHGYTMVSIDRDLPVTLWYTEHGNA